MKKILTQTHLKNMVLIIIKWEIPIVKMEQLKIRSTVSNMNKIF